MGRALNLTADKMCCLAQGIRNPPFVDGFFIESPGGMWMWEPPPQSQGKLVTSLILERFSQ